MGIPVNCTSGATSTIVCDDQNDCTENDVEVIITANGVTCVPCMGTPIDCATGATSTIPCDNHCYDKHFYPRSSGFSEQNQGQ